MLGGGVFIPGVKLEQIHQSGTEPLYLINHFFEMYGVEVSRCVAMATVPMTNRCAWYSKRCW